MKLRLTANAGLLIKIDGISLLLDGVCEELENFFGTPAEIKRELSVEFPDAVGFTHRHRDHYDENYARFYTYKTLRPVLGSKCSHLRVGNVVIDAIPTRHIGKNDVEHFSFVIKGTKKIFFMGDASPSELKKLSEFGKPDVLIVPFAYLNSQTALKTTKNANAEKIVLVHMPNKQKDYYDLWKSLENTIKNEDIFFFDKIGDIITLI